VKEKVEVIKSGGNDDDDDDDDDVDRVDLDEHNK